MQTRCKNTPDILLFYIARQHACLHDTVVSMAGLIRPTFFLSAENENESEEKPLEFSILLFQ